MAIKQLLLSGRLFEMEKRSFSKRANRKYLASASAFSYSAAFVFLIVLTSCHAAAPYKNLTDCVHKHTCPTGWNQADRGR